MKKIYVDEKIKLYNEIYKGVVQISKSNNYYVKHTINKVKIKTKNTPFNITKNNFENLFKEIKFEKEESIISMLKPTGSLLVKYRKDTKFKQATLKSLNSIYIFKELIPIFLIGKKYQWIQDYPEYWNYKLPIQFSSHREFIDFLGYDFLTEEAFKILLNKIQNLSVLISCTKLYKNKKKLVAALPTILNDLGSYEFIEYLELVKEKDVTISYNPHTIKEQLTTGEYEKTRNLPF